MSKKPKLVHSIHTILFTFLNTELQHEKTNQMQSLRFFIRPLLMFILITAACVATLTWVDLDWSTWAPATCYPKHCFCEKVHAGAVRQPMNTWSNLAFVFVGLLIFGVVARDEDSETPTAPHNPMNQETLYAKVLGISIVLIGVTSLFYHASLSFLGQWFDVMSMYLLANFVLIYNLSRLKLLKIRGFIIGYIAINALCGYIQYAMPSVRRYLFGILLVLALISIIQANRRLQTQLYTRHILRCLAVFAAAFGIWILDIKGILCWPDSLFQGHAIWHVLCAAAAGFIYLYYRSEQPLEQAS